MLTIEQILIIMAILLALGVVASKASSKLGVPALLLFLLIGILAGSEGPGRIPFDNAGLAQSVGVVALAFILFAGGLDTNWRVVAPVLWQALSLASIGVFITAIIVGWFSTVLLGVDWLHGLLVGAIVSSTDAAAVFSVLRSQGISLKGRIQPLLELESGTNDPMAVFLTVGIIHLIQSPGQSPWLLVLLFLKQMLIGGVAGWAIGRAAVPLINRLNLDAEGLYSALTVAIVLFSYGVTTALGGSGFLAVYLTGVVMGNRDFVHRRSLTTFHSGLAWLMQIILFLVLGLLVYPSRLLPVMGVSVLLALFLVVVARPLGVFISLAFGKVGLRPKILISWIGLRGAVPIVLATFPLLEGVQNAEIYFNIVFFTVSISLLLQGTTIGWLAQKLKLQKPLPATDRRFPLEMLPAGEEQGQVVEITVSEGSNAVDRQLVALHLPREAHIMLVTRKNEHLVPRGSTTIRAGDILSVLADQEALGKVRSIMIKAPPVEHDPEASF
ncbi:potassium/proton antiporter [Edaphobacter sp. 12200R-103]|jgi:cell volume regulation protein A|uniref:potassium/proton antiporter n=1 Tax=Edaphobacter sp. 12200R-103 TaxID=2703788 RepID=UPI00138CC884|nr:potassium/proton antiporter [Edaphobacter sp. 12200R-103]QHS51738.1 potassium/proton antiporter [Edaphobacter sp. 12200R-103]